MAKKTIQFPDLKSKDSGAGEQSKIFDALEETSHRINRHNAITALENMSLKNRGNRLRRIYHVLRKHIYPGYKAKAVISEMKKYSGISEITIKRSIYNTKGRKNLHS